jgi:hypothetical protein
LPILLVIAQIINRHERLISMKKFSVGIVVGIALTCVWGIASAKIQQHNAIKERDRAVKAEQAARAAAETAAPQAPLR